MSSKLSQKHAHKFKRHHYSTGNEVYFCTLDDCTFRIDPKLALGKTAVCWRCGKDFKLNSYSITLAKPHCEDCHIHKGEFKKKAHPEPVINQVAMGIATSGLDSMKSRLQALESGTVTIHNELENVEFIELPNDEEDLL